MEDKQSGCKLRLYIVSVAVLDQPGQRNEDIYAESVLIPCRTESEACMCAFRKYRSYMPNAYVVNMSARLLEDEEVLAVLAEAKRMESETDGKGTV